MSDTQGTIMQRLLSNIPDKYDKTVGSFFYDTQKPLAIEGEQIYKNIDEVLNKGFVTTAEGEYLDKKVAEQGIIRKEATYAVGVVTVTGSVGAIIPVGLKVSSDNIMFSTIAAATISESGSIDISIQCDVPGIDGNLPTGAIKSFPVTIAGLTGVNNAQATAGGYGAETDDELRKRYFEKVSAPATSGNKYNYVMWAKEVVGVGDAKCLPLWNGAGTVKVIIINSERQAADSTLIATVEEYIEENRPIGATVTVESATPLVVNISATLHLQTETVLSSVESLIENAINDCLKKIAFEQTYISYAQIGGTILQIDGVLDYEDLLVNETADNITIAENQVPVLGVVSLV